jgi:hypothetical protein
MSKRTEALFQKGVDTPIFWRKLRAPMNHQSIILGTRQRSALQVCARALDIVMR